MSLATYADLQSRVLSFLHRAEILDSVGADMIPDLILLGEKWLFRNAEAKEQETALNVAMSGGVATVPTDFNHIKYAYVDGTPTRYLFVRPAAWIIQTYPQRSSDRKPSYMGVDAGNFIFGPFPDADYTIKGTYYADLTSIQSSANALFLKHPDLYLYAALAEAEGYIKNDKRVGLWTAKRDELVEDVNNQANAADFGGGGMNVAPG